MNKRLGKAAFLAILLLVPGISVGEEITATVKGMVCSFCAQGIKKTFGKNEHVEKVDVDLDNKIVTLTTREGHSLTDELVTKGINDAGYDVVKIERKKDA